MCVVDHSRLRGLMCDICVCDKPAGFVRVWTLLLIQLCKKDIPAVSVCYAQAHIHSLLHAASLAISARVVTPAMKSPVSP